MILISQNWILSIANFRVGHINNMKKIMIFLIFAGLLYSCKSFEYKQDVSGEQYAKKVILKISNKEKITEIGRNYLHIKIEKLVGGYYLSHISINSLRPKKYSSKFNYLGFEVYLYSSENSERTKFDDSPFFVPDSRQWDFLLFIRDSEIISIKQLTIYENIDIEEYREIKVIK